MLKDTIKSRLDFQLTNINGNLPKINNRKIYDFSLTQIVNKREPPMTEPTESVIIRRQQKFDLNDVLNPVEIEIYDDRILNILNKHKNIYYKLTPIGLFFPSSITNNTKQIFITCRELNDAKKSWINSKFYSLLGVINLEKINSSENIKGKSLWVNVSFNEQEQINSSHHICFLFKKSSCNDLLSFSINLIDNKNQQISFNSGDQKISILKFKKDVFSR